MRQELQCRLALDIDTRVRISLISTFWARAGSITFTFFYRGRTANTSLRSCMRCVIVAHGSPVFTKHRDHCLIITAEISDARQFDVHARITYIILDRFPLLVLSSAFYYSLSPSSVSVDLRFSAVHLMISKRYVYYA